MGAQSFNFVSKVPQIGIFSCKFRMFGRKFSDIKKIFRQTTI